jgi:hypothetical protein
MAAIGLEKLSGCRSRCRRGERIAAYAVFLEVRGEVLRQVRTAALIAAYSTGVVICVPAYISNRGASVP